MGNTGNSQTYPYGIRTTIEHDEVYNRVTGESVSTHARYTTHAAQALNKLVSAFKSANPLEKARIVAPKVSAIKAVG